MIRSERMDAVHELQCNIEQLENKILLEENERLWNENEKLLNGIKKAKKSLDDYSSFGAGALIILNRLLEGD